MQGTAQMIAVPFYFDPEPYQISIRNPLETVWENTFEVNYQIAKKIGFVNTYDVC